MCLLRGGLLNPNKVALLPIVSVISNLPLLPCFCSHDAVVKQAQERVDALLAITLQLRASYNAANLLCNPTAQALEQCKAAAVAWVLYRSTSAALDAAQTELQEVATASTTAQKLQTAKAAFSAQQALANDVVVGSEWARRAAAAAKLQAATAAFAEAEHGRVAAQMRRANAEFVQAQEVSRTLLSPEGAEYQAVREAKDALKAARAGLRAATAVPRLTPAELSAAAQELSSILAQVNVQKATLEAAISSANAAAPATAASAGVADVGGLVRFNQINVGTVLDPTNPQVALSVSYNGAVGSGDQQKALSGLFRLDVTDRSAEELGLVLAEILRDDALNAIRATHTSLAALL
jgi:hypothetical protein